MNDAHIGSESEPCSGPLTRPLRAIPLGVTTGRDTEKEVLQAYGKPT